MAKKPIPNKPGVSNWVERAGHLPPMIRRIAEHLHGQGKDVGHSIAIAVNAVKKGCATGDLNWPGKQSMNPASRAEYCAAASQWEAMKARSASAARPEGEIMEFHDGLYTEIVDDAAEIEAALTAGAAPVRPPKQWFDDPRLDTLTPLTITADGQVFGHIASWDVDHIGLPGSRKPPRSKTGYAFFRTGVVETADGSDVPVGQLTYTGGHAPLSASSEQTVKHYDDTASAIADVAIGEDNHGPWVAGALRPGVTEEQIRAVRASAPSGDWRPINGNLELVAVCQVNVPGFPVARSMVAGGEILSLVAAGAAPLFELRQEQHVLGYVQEMAQRIDALEREVQGGMTASAEVLEVDEAAAELLDDDEVDEVITAQVDDPGSIFERYQWRADERRRTELEARVASARRARMTAQVASLRSR